KTSITVSTLQRIDVARVGRMRQLVEPARHGRRLAPFAELLALSQGCVEALEAERGTAVETGARHIALDGGELERQRLHRLSQPCQRFGLESLNVDLDEGWLAMFGNQGIKRGRLDLDRLVPDLPLPAGCAIGCLQKGM